MNNQVKEEWRPIKSYENYEGFYEVSNTGKVRSVTRTVRRKRMGDYVVESMELAQQTDRGGYRRVTLQWGASKKYRKVHRLVAEAFLPNPDNLPQINHKDEDKTNNHVDNLEWCTAKYNLNYGTARERQSISASKPILQLDRDTLEIVNRWVNARKIKQALGFSQGAVYGWCQDYAEAEGFVWCYESDYGKRKYEGVKRRRYDPNKPKHVPKRHNILNVPVCQVDMTTHEVIKTYPAASAVKADGFDNSCVTQCCRGKLKKHGGYYWCYESDYGSTDFKAKGRSPLMMPVRQIDPKTGETIREWNSMSVLYKEKGYANKLIGDCCRGKRPDAYGFRWEFVA